MCIFARTFGSLPLLAVWGMSGCTLLMQGTFQDVSFTSDPPGAAFTVAGQTAVTPASLEIPKEDCTIVFTRLGFHDASIELHCRTSPYFYGSVLMGVIAAVVDIATGAWKEFESTEVHVVMQPLPGTVQEIRVKITSEPSQAKVLLQGAEYGFTPAELNLGWLPLESQKEITLVLARHLPKTVVLKRDQACLHAILDPELEIVAVRFESIPPGAEIRIDGRSWGKTPLTVNVEWRPGATSKTVELIHDGYRPEKRPLERTQTELTLTLEEIVEEIPITVSVDPPGSGIEVDGVAAGVSPAKIPLRWSVSRTLHTLTLSHPGYRSKTVEVRRADTFSPLEIHLTPSLPRNP